jgi:phosphoglycerate dehydrogenase-like enzyme
MADLTIVIPDDDPPAYGSLDHPDLRRLAVHGNVVLHSRRWNDRAELFDRIADADVVLNVRAYSVFDDEALAHAPRLRLVSRLGTGTDNVDLEAARRRGVCVTNTPDILSTSVAELALGLTLAVARAIPLSDRRLRAGLWQHEVGPQLHGKTLGLFGLGSIGREFARLGRGLGMRVLGWSYRHDPARAAECGVELVERDEVFRQSDVVSLHLRYSPEASGFVGARELGLMKPSAILINTARAALVDEEALLDALRERRITGAGLDVYVKEPLPLEANPYKGLDNVVIMPHAGGTTREGNLLSRSLPVENIIAFLEGRSQHVVNP